MIFKFLFSVFGHLEKRLDQKEKVNFKFCDVKTWEKNNYNTHIAEYLSSKDNQTIQSGQLKEYNKRNIF